MLNMNQWYLCGLTRTASRAAILLKKVRIPCTILLAAATAFAQTASLSLGSVSAQPGNSLSLNLSLNTTMAPAALQWTISYPQSDITSINISPGPALSAAGKNVSCNTNTGSIMCLASGMNSNSIANGTVAVVTATLAPVISGSPLNILVTNAAEALADGSAGSITGTGGAITVQGWAPPPVTVTGLSCAPSSFVTPGNTSCTATLSAAAPSGGVVLSLGDNNTALSTPASISVAAGATSASFTASGSVVNTMQTATITASLNGTSASTAVTMLLPASGLVAAYAFNEGSGSTVSDASGNGNTGQIQGARWTTNGKYGAGLVFDGSTAIVTINDTAALHLTTGMTLEAWVNSSAVDGAWRDVIYKGNDNYFLEATSYTGNAAPAAGSTFGVSYGSTGLTANTWVHLAATYDGAAMRLYVNGVLASSMPYTGALPTSTNPLQIGGDNIFGQYFSGTIDEVRIYKVALTQEQIQADMNTAIGASTAADTQPPTAPSNLTATPANSTQINLSWTPSTDNVGVASYLLERCQGTGCSSFAQIATMTAANYTDTGVVAGTSYSYRVRATDAARNLSIYSNIASAVLADTQPPTAPSNLTATPANFTQINLSWTPSTDNIGVAGYLLERCQGTGCSSFAQIATVTAATYTDTNIAAGTSYSYRVRANDAVGNLSSYSNVVTIVTPRAITGLVAAYSFNEGTGTTVADASGNGNTGIIANASWATGIYGSALSFNGRNAVVTIKDSVSLHLTTAMTLEAWVKPAEVTGAWRDVIYKGNDNYFLEGTSNRGGKPAIGATLGTTNLVAYGSAALATNTWVHLAATYDGTALCLYVNGILMSTLGHTGNIATSTYPLQIGGDSIFGQYFNGIIDEVRVYNVALTAAQVQADMKTPITGNPAAGALLLTKAASYSEMGSSNAETSSSAQITSWTLSCSPRVVEAGSQATCEVYAPTTTGALKLNLASSSGQLKLPKVITSRPNQSRLTFQVFIDPAAKQQSATISAMAGNSLVQDTILITPSASPLLQVPGSQLVRFGSPLQFIVGAVDPQNLPLQLTAAGLPPGASFDPASGQFQWTPQASQAGQYRVSFTATNSALQTATAHVMIEVGPGNPSLAASQSSACSPGAIARLTGKWLAAPGSHFSDPSGKSTEVGGTQVKVNGQAVPLLRSSATEVEFLCPALNQTTPLSIVVETAVGTTNPWSTTMQAASPTIFSLDDSEDRQGLISFTGSAELAMARNFRIAAHPAQPADSLKIWATGLGATANPASSGALMVTFAGLPAEVEDVQAVPGYAGMYTIQVRVPNTSPIGEAVPVQFQVTDMDGKPFVSNIVTVAIEDERY